MSHYISDFLKSSIFLKPTMRVKASQHAGRKKEVVLRQDILLPLQGNVNNRGKTNRNWGAVKWFITLTPSCNILVRCLTPLPASYGLITAALDALTKMSQPFMHYLWNVQQHFALLFFQVYFLQVPPRGSPLLQRLPEPISTHSNQRNLTHVAKPVSSSWRRWAVWKVTERM